MLLEFRMKNYKSFHEETTFSMLAAPKQSGLDYSLCKVNYGGIKLKGLCSSVIYGPNAAGKTNIIGAMDVLRTIILRGNIRNAESLSPNAALENLELIPNNQLDEAEPVEFYIDFFEKNLRIQYALILDLGRFLDNTHKRKILREELSVNDKNVFRRSDTLEMYIDENEGFFHDAIKQNETGAIEIAKNSLHDEELFLTNGFKNIFSPVVVSIITDWVSNKFMVIYRANSMHIVKQFADPQKKAAYIEKPIYDAVQIFGANSNVIGYVTGTDEPEPRLCSIFNGIKDYEGVAIAAENFESYGTVRFINMFPLVIRALQTGGTLIVDEFDASIHPMALMSIINIFHNDDINVKQAQLIFNTHNPIFLNSNLFRRDEIKFVEREDESHLSSLYSLSDFGTTGKNGVRLHDDYMKHYFISKYGAIKDIDFTPVFEEMLANEGEV